MNSTRTVVSLAAAVAVLAISCLAAAQGGPARGPEKRRAVEEKIRTLRLMKLVNALDLDETTAIKVAGILKGTDERRQALHEEGRSHMSALEQEVEATSPRAKELNRLMDKLLAVRQEVHGLDGVEVLELRKVLTPLQQAKFVLVMRDFRHEVHQLMRREKRRGRRGAGGPGGPGGPPPGGPPGLLDD